MYNVGRLEKLSWAVPQNVSDSLCATNVSQMCCRIWISGHNTLIQLRNIISTACDIKLSESTHMAACETQLTPSPENGKQNTTKLISNIHLTYSDVEQCTVKIVRSAHGSGLARQWLAGRLWNRRDSREFHLGWVNSLYSLCTKVHTFALL